MTGVRVAVGVILLLVAGVNVLSGSAFLVVAGAGDAMGELRSGRHVEASHRADRAKLDELHQDTATWRIFAYALFVLAALQVAASVMLFIDQLPVFVVVVGTLGLFAEGAGMYLTHHLKWTNIIGAAGSAMAAVIAVSIYKRAGRRSGGWVGPLAAGVLVAAAVVGAGIFVRSVLADVEHPRPNPYGEFFDASPE